MTLHLPTLLLVCIAALALAAGTMTLFGGIQRVYRGFWWWVAAQWLLVAGLALQALREPYPALLPVAALLMLQWPILVLMGMRRFYPRRTFALPPSADGLLLAIAYMLWLAAWAASGSLAARLAAFSVGAMGLHLYSAWLLGGLAEIRGSAALKTLVGLNVLVALVHAVRIVIAVAGPADLGDLGDSASALVLSGLAVMIAALLMPCVALLFGHERTESDLRATHRKLRYLADIDMLTRVPNRRHFHELARRALAGTEPGAATLVMFDIDHFKRINDLLGHATGDEALRQVALAVRESLRENDVAGRLGGDEFALLLPQTVVDDAMGVASRVASMLEHRQVAPRTARLSLSFGMVQMHADESLADALRRADQALYEAKRQGRSRAVVASGFEARPIFGESRAMGLGHS
ncbi:hypothetical protein BH11PSE8_BH11PSE8_43360 [soil metagenome]